jgi:predicted RNA-binding Zn-ribbon protein involved in translation (DUF1610 family)
MKVEYSEKKPLPGQELRWWRCPECGKNLFMVRSEAKIRGMQIKCRGCRKIINVSL